ncbi:hypothetical protein F3Y22_tig00111835pilonHSYRG00041 [Hibiscus syriacus]|uniref:Uncharacterized protein n=1 Tax=Hibiscus syriacus TaxID=106335 RepID=A0A6A2Y7M8_HIBSY|nr:hypothetical protein F3Y22_tig00111835pilonHSYRG00041 [Hibiscus syriacus]
MRKTSRKSSENKTEEVEAHEGGAIWDIFQKEDVPKLQDYLRKHCGEFRYVHCCPVSEVLHPVHDQSFYLTMDHEAKLAGIWLNYLALYLHVRQSCIKVALVRLTEESRLLPHDHMAEEDKLEVKKMKVHTWIQMQSKAHHML